VDHEEAGVGMRRLQPLVAFLVLALAIGGAVYADREVGARSFEPGADGAASSGVWFCPHGGGPEGWEVDLQVANPGDEAATIRVRTLGEERPAAPETLRVEPGSFLQVPVQARGRARGSVVEWFGSWVAVGWVAHAGGGEGGVAAEPCAPQAGERWLLPDGTTESDTSSDLVVVMNPFAREAVFSVTLLSERQEPVRQGELTDVALRPFRAVAFPLNDVVLGERTVAARVDVSVGRVAAATLGVVKPTGGIRSAIGYLGAPPETLAFPGGGDSGRTDLVVMNGAEDVAGRAALDGLLEGTQGGQPFPGLADASLPPGSGRTFPATTDGPTTVVLTVTGRDVATVRRTFGVTSDQAAVTGVEPAAAWIVLPAVAGFPSNPGLVLSNPGTEPAVVTLRYLLPGPPEEVEVTVPPGGTAQAPEEFALLAPEVGVVASATTGTFVPAAASYSLGREGMATYAVALGIPMPEGSA
jgi:hypothetical protein